MSLHALDKASRQKIAVWGSYAQSGDLCRASFNAVLGAVEVRYSTGYNAYGYNERSDAIICTPEEGAAVITYLKSRRPPRPLTRQARLEKQVAHWKTEILKGGAEQYLVVLVGDSKTVTIYSKGQSIKEEGRLSFDTAEEARSCYETFSKLIESHRIETHERLRRLEEERLAPVRAASFPKWAEAGFPIYSLCQLQCSGGYNPMPTIQGKGMWMPEGFSTSMELESAFWEYLSSKGCASCATCGKRPTVYRRFTPPPNSIVPSPIATEQPGLFSSMLGEVTTCGHHWIRHPHTGYGSIGAKFELTPAKSGITLRCCDNIVKLDS